MYGTVVGHGSNNHHGRSYKIRVSKMSHIIIRTNRHVKNIPITVEEYMRNEVTKKDKILGANRFNKLINHYTKLYENETIEIPVTSNCGPIMNAPHVEPSPLPVAGRGKRDNKGETCHNSSIREHTHAGTMRNYYYWLGHSPGMQEVCGLIPP